MTSGRMVWSPAACSGTRTSEHHHQEDTCREPAEARAATAISRAWLSSGRCRLHEDPSGRDPERIVILGSGVDPRTGERFVLLRQYIPRLDIEHVIEGTHMDGITVDTKERAP